MTAAKGAPRKDWFWLRVLGVSPELGRCPYTSENEGRLRGVEIGAPGDERLAWLDRIRIDVGESGRYNRVEADTVRITVETGGEDGRVCEVIVHRDGSVRLYS